MINNINNVTMAKHLPALFGALKIAVHLFTIATFGFHRDELLYLALGRHPDWGYWSNPPFIGAVTWCSQQFLGDSVWATRLPSVLAGGAVVWLSLLMVRELGGGARALVMCGLISLLSPAWLRINSMLQPVPFDILFWTMLSFGLLRWINTRDTRWWWFVGLTAGIGFLNKYTLVFWAAALLVALLLTPERKMLATRPVWQAAGIALALILPNLLWQWQYGFPVIHHMDELARYQLRNVEPLHFLLDQLLMHGPGFVFWLAGLAFLLFSKGAQPYRIFGWFYLALLCIFLIMSGKSYYTLGAYPVLLAAGAVFWDKILQKNWQKIALTGVVAASTLPLVPVGIPLYSGDRAIAYFNWLTYDAGIDGAVRWEDGELHALPQDFADMLGWHEIGHLVDTAITRAGDHSCVVYGENYGQAGAAEHLSQKLPDGMPVVSFSDSYLLWAPDTLSPAVQTLIYINGEGPGEDVLGLFADIQLVGKVENPLARERGTGVWLCRNARSDVAAFWAKRVKEVKSVLRR